MNIYPRLWVILLAGIVIVSSQKKPDDKNTKYRKDIYKLSLLELESYVIAVNTVLVNQTAAIQNLTAQYVSKLEPQQVETSKTRLDNTNYMYLNEFEKLLQSVNPEVHVPYWNWTVYSSDPSRDPVFSRTLFGKAIDDKGCLAEGNFYKAHTYEEECIKRRLPSPYPNLVKITDLMNDRVYESARSRLRTMTLGVAEKYSGYPTKAQLPRDPLLYSLYSFEMRLLYMWGERHHEDIDAKADNYKINNKKDYDV